MKGFIESNKGVEVSHNTLHNNFGYILSDPSFSVTSFVFWPYHSWIDLQIEFKMRRANAPGNASDYDYLVNTLDNKYNPMDPENFDTLNFVFNQVSSDVQPMSNWQLSKDS